VSAGRAAVPGRDADARADAVVEVVDVSHRYGRLRPVEVLHDVRMTVRRNEFVALVGRSGSGKSTLCHLVAGLGRPSSGQIRVAGRPADARPDWARLALLPQRPALVPELSVAQNAFLATRLRDRADDEDLLVLLGIDALAGRSTGQVSLGEQQRVGIARALAVRPLVAVLDEPTGHQDDDNVDRVLDTLRQAGSRGTALLVATHDPRVLAAADRVVRMRDGRVVDEDRP
jgi:putative ABC transport system ATP-binding protein